VNTTPRLLLTPIGPAHAGELHLLHQDPGIAEWYGPWTEEDALNAAVHMGDAWRTEGVHKWLAHHRGTGELIGRGGLSYAEVDGARRLEVGWAVRRRFWGEGYATEIGRAALAVAYAELAAAEVVSFTETHNHRSRAVRERLGFAFSHDFLHHGEPFVLYVHQPGQAG
jgi:[ribosomal protein S5]-alanine N-acetyltransferase